MGSVVDNLEHCQDQIAHIFDHYALPERQVNLVIVSKYRSTEEIIPLLDKGHKVFGENQLQEAVQKWPDLKKRYAQIKLHMIGNIQSNKLFSCCDMFDVIETIDRPKLIDKCVIYREKNGRLPKLFLQVNIGQEPQKSGCLPQDIAWLLDYAAQRNIFFEGLMCIPPKGNLSLVYFSCLKKLSLQHQLPLTSMGMSADYPQAILCGADHIRVGSSIFMPYH